MIDIEKDYSRIAHSLSRDETRRVNHEGCPAGLEIRQRLYLTRTAGSPGVVLAYCHNCQESGVYKAQTMFRNDFSIIETNKPYVQLNNAAPPNNMIDDPSSWPDLAIEWRIAKKLSTDNCKYIGIKHDPNSDRIYLPTWTQCIKKGPILNSILGYQLRKINNKVAGPKYYTVIKDTSRPVSTSLPNIGASIYNVTVLVEDLISGIIIQEAVKAPFDLTVNVIVNYGVKIDVEVLSKWRRFTNGVVWLDNDNTHVVEQAEKMARVWGMISGAPVSIVKGYSDPKNYTPSKIRSIIHKAIAHG